MRSVHKSALLAIISIVLVTVRAGDPTSFKRVRIPGSLNIIWPWTDSVLIGDIVYLGFQDTEVVYGVHRTFKLSLTYPDGITSDLYNYSPSTCTTAFNGTTLHTSPVKPDQVGPYTIWWNATWSSNLDEENPLNCSMAGSEERVSLSRTFRVFPLQSGVTGYQGLNVSGHTRSAAFDSRPTGIAFVSSSGMKEVVIISRLVVALLASTTLVSLLGLSML